MSLNDAMNRIQNNARQIKALSKTPQTPETKDTIHQHALLIERETAFLAGQAMATQGSA